VQTQWLLTQRLQVEMTPEVQQQQGQSQVSSPVGLTPHSSSSSTRSM
jgi:hypothetical protein